jgi:RNA polymerase sigma-70 factor (ECF subfamily)
MMPSTSLSLLQQLRESGEQQAWDRFVQLYTPLLYRWARQLGLPPQEVPDLVQEVFITLVPKLREFVYDPDKSFRAWLRTVAMNRFRRYWRGKRCETPGDLPDVEAPDSTTVFEEAEYRQYLVKRALELMQVDFQPTTWKACWEVTVADRPAEDVARELGLTVNAVYLAKSRVLCRLREVLDGLLD